MPGNVVPVINMHEHDLDLVAAYAEGSASSADATRCTEWIENCSECATEFEFQTIALEAIAAAAPFAMTDLERAKVHRGVREAIAEHELVEVAERPAAARATTRSAAPSRWPRILTGTAAAAAALVLAGTALLNGGITGSADTADVAATEPTEATFAAAATAESAEASSDAAADDGALGMMEPLDIVQDLGEVTFDGLVAMATPPAAEADDLATDETIGRDVPNSIPPRVEDDSELRPALGCLETGFELLEDEPTLLAVATLDGVPIEIYQSDRNLVAVTAADCIVVFPVDR